MEQNDFSYFMAFWRYSLVSILWGSQNSENTMKLSVEELENSFRTTENLIDCS